MMGGKTMLYKLKENELESIAFEDFGNIGKKEKDLENIFAQNLEMSKRSQIMEQYRIIVS